MIIVFPHTVRDIGESLSMEHAESKVKNQKALVNILQNVKFLGRQGLALHGHDDRESNFLVQLFKLRELDNPEMIGLLEKTKDKYVCPQVQNEMLQMMSLSIL